MVEFGRILCRSRDVEVSVEFLRMGGRRPGVSGHGIEGGTLGQPCEAKSIGEGDRRTAMCHVEPR